MLKEYELVIVSCLFVVFFFVYVIKVFLLGLFVLKSFKLDNDYDFFLVYIIFRI